MFTERWWGTALLPGEIVSAPSLKEFTARLDEPLGSLIYGGAILPIAQGLELHDLRGPLQPKPSCESVKSSTPTTAAKAPAAYFYSS